MSITTKLISKLVEVLEGVENVTIRTDWLDKDMRKFHRAREHHELVQNVNTLRVQTEELKSNCIL